jgi:hypothetical protein
VDRVVTLGHVLGVCVDSPVHGVADAGRLVGTRTGAVLVRSRVRRLPAQYDYPPHGLNDAVEPVVKQTRTWIQDIA